MKKKQKNTGARALQVEISDFAENDRLDALHDIYRGSFGVSVEDGVVPASSLSACAVGDLVVGKYFHSGYQLRRDCSTSVHTKQELVVLRVFLSGYVRGEIGGESVLMKPGDVHVLNYDAVMRYSGPQREHMSVAVPYSVVGFDPSIHKSVTSLSKGTAMARMIGDLIINAHTSGVDALPDERAVIADSLTNMVKSVLEGGYACDPRRSDFSKSREDSVRRYILANLRNPALDVTRICADNSISRATLYRMLRDEGGVHQVIKNLRLDAVRQDLARAEWSPGVVKRTAQSWCFNDPASFSKSFAKRFAYKPTDLQTACEPDGAVKANAAPDRLSQVNLLALYEARFSSLATGLEARVA